MIPKSSLLYISINVDHDHPLRRIVVDHMDQLPDLDLNRITRLIGSDYRPYFKDVIDATIDTLPRDFSGISGIIIGCSGHTVNLDRVEEFKPWQKRLIQFIREAILVRDIPYLGLCGGGQIGLVALGGKVRSNPEDIGTFSDDPGSMVIGPTKLSLTEDGAKDPIFKDCADEIVMTAIHADYMAELPENNTCRVLANGEKLCNQVIAYKDKVRLFGVHPEISQEFLNDTMKPILDEGGFGFADRENLDKAFYNVFPTSEQNKKIIENFILGICTQNHESKLAEHQSPLNVEAE